MSVSLERFTAAFALVYVALFVSLVAFTTTGPDPTLAPEIEMSRALSEATALRASAVLGLGTDVAFAGFAVGLALIMLRLGDARGGALTATAGGVAAAIGAVSFSALVVSVEAAKRGLGADVFAAFGDMHTAALLAELAPMGFVLLLAWRAGLGRVASWLGLVVGLASVIGAGSVMSTKLDQGPLGLLVFVWFIGLPLWLVVTSVALLRRREESAAAALIE